MKTISRRLKQISNRLLAISVSPIKWSALWKRHFDNDIKPFILCKTKLWSCLLFPGLLDHWETGALSWIRHICVIPDWPDHYQSPLRLSPSALKYVRQTTAFTVSKALHTAGLTSFSSGTSGTLYTLGIQVHCSFGICFRFYEGNTTI